MRRKVRSSSAPKLGSRERGRERDVDRRKKVRQIWKIDAESGSQSRSTETC